MVYLEKSSDVCLTGIFFPLKISMTKKTKIPGKKKKGGTKEVHFACHTFFNLISPDRETNMDLV